MPVGYKIILLSVSVFYDLVLQMMYRGEICPVVTCFVSVPRVFNQKELAHTVALNEKYVLVWSRLIVLIPCINNSHFLAAFPEVR